MDQLGEAPFGKTTWRPARREVSFKIDYVGKKLKNLSSMNLVEQESVNKSSTLEVSLVRASQASKEWPVDWYWGGKEIK